MIVFHICYSWLFYRKIPGEFSIPDFGRLFFWPNTIMIGSFMLRLLTGDLRDSRWSSQAPSHSLPSETHQHRQGPAGEFLKLRTIIIWRDTNFLCITSGSFSDRECRTCIVLDRQRWFVRRWAKVAWLRRFDVHGCQARWQARWQQEVSF